MPHLEVRDSSRATALTPNRCSLLALLTLLVASAAAAAGWQTYTSRAGGFSVQFPTTPTNHTSTMPTAVGTVKTVSVDSKTPTVECMVMYIDYPIDKTMNSDVESMLDGAVNGALQSSHGKLLKQTKLTMKGHHTRDVSIATQGMVINCRLVVVKNRLYQVMTVCPAANTSSPTISKFIHSFQLL